MKTNQIKWSWYAPRNANKVTIRTADFVEWDFMTGLNKDKKTAFLQVFRYNPKGYKTVTVLNKEFQTIGDAMLYAHIKITKMLQSGGSKIV